jgi:hypothetical protein
MAALKVRKECLESTVFYNYLNSSKSVKLSEATHEQLVILKDLGVDVFEKTEKEK